VLTKPLGLGQPEVKPVEQALVDNRSLHGLPKKPSCDETGSSTSYGWSVWFAYFWHSQNYLHDL